MRPAIRRPRRRRASRPRRQPGRSCWRPTISTVRTVARSRMDRHRLGSSNRQPAHSGDERERRQRLDCDLHRGHVACRPVFADQRARRDTALGRGGHRSRQERSGYRDVLRLRDRTARPKTGLTLAKFVTHVYTELWTSVLPVNAGDTLYLGVQGTTLTVKLNGNTLTTQTDGSITAPGFAGFDVTDYDGKGAPGDGQLDNWVGGTFDASGAITAPTNLQTTAVTSNEIDLAWTASTAAAGVARYNVLRNGTQVGTSTTPAFADTGLAASTNYTYTDRGRRHQRRDLSAVGAAQRDHGSGRRRTGYAATVGARRARWHRHVKQPGVADLDSIDRQRRRHWLSRHKRRQPDRHRHHAVIRRQRAHREYNVSLHCGCVRCRRQRVGRVLDEHHHPGGPTAPFVLVADGFNRPNGVPGSGWTVIDSDPRIVGQHIQETNATDG